MKLSAKSIVLISLCAGLVAATLVYHFLAKERARTAQLAERVSVVVATRPIAARTVIDPSAVRLILRPASVVPANCAGSMDEVIGQVAMLPLGEGEPISRQAVVPRTASLGLAFVVPQGMRAVAVALDPIIGVAGFLKPSDRVDVLATFTTDELKSTRTVLQDVSLLAIGPEVRPAEGCQPTTEKDARPKDQPNAILAVTPEQAEKLILAEVSGRLRLTLRSVGDQGRVALAGVRSDTLFGIQPSRPATTTNQSPAPKSGPSSPVILAAAAPRPATTNASPTAVAAASSPAAFGLAQGMPPARGMQSIETIRGTQRSIIEVPIDIMPSEKSASTP